MNLLEKFENGEQLTESELDQLKQNEPAVAAILEAEAEEEAEHQAFLASLYE